MHIRGNKELAKHKGEKGVWKSDLLEFIVYVYNLNYFINNEPRLKVF
jgi:hypothetical protein